MSQITTFIKHHYRHFNAAALVDAAEDYIEHLDAGGKMLVTIAGAMATAELGISLAEMIRQDKVHAICCTGANLEEDIFNLVAHDHYERVPHYRYLRRAGRASAARPPHEPRHRHLHPRGGSDAPDRIGGARSMDGSRTTRPASASSRTSSCTRSCATARSKSSTRSIRRTRWMIAAAEKNLPDVRSRLGRLDPRQHVRRPLHHRRREERAHRPHRHRVHDGARRLVHRNLRRQSSIGFFQIGGGIAGDFPICVVPMLHQDLQRDERPAVGLLLPDQRLDDELRLVLRRRAERENHLGQTRRRHAQVIIESDASIVAPLMFAYVLGVVDSRTTRVPRSRSPRRLGPGRPQFSQDSKSLSARCRRPRGTHNQRELRCRRLPGGILRSPSPYTFQPLLISWR